MANGARDIIRQTPGLQSQSPSHPRAVALSLLHNATSAYGLTDRARGKCYILEDGKKNTNLHATIPGMLATNWRAIVT